MNNELIIGLLYHYKGNLYKIKDFGKLKNPTTRKWESCVFYSCSKGLTYAREITDFKSKFESFQ